MFGNAAGKGTKGQGHKLPRTRITAEKFTGHCVAWKGNYGWVKPLEPIEHEKASLNGGSLFISKDSLEGVTELTPGAPCEFHIWEDDSGLGGDEVIETGEVDPEFEIPAKGAGKNGGGKGADKGASPAKGFGKTPFASKGWEKGFDGVQNGWGGVVPPGKGAAKGAWGQPSPAMPVAGGFAKGKGNGFEKGGCAKGGFDNGKGKDGKDGKAKKGAGHKLPRTRITAEKFTGTVKAWKGKFGWIVPAEEVTHDLASKNNGCLFCSISDLEGGLTELTPEATVEFHIWEDPTGLGAEEVIQY